MIDKLYQDGEIVSLNTLQEKGIAPRRVSGGLKILSNGDLTKKVSIEARFFSQATEEKLKRQGISYQKITS